jgi:acetate---CoA ligase (ADP-forming)
MSAGSLGGLFRPRSVAMVGASGRPDSLSFKALTQLRRFGFPGEIYLVNPKYESIEGLPCWPSVEDLPGPADVALFFVGADRTVDAVCGAGQAGTPFGVVYSSGFGEAGHEGRLLEAELRDVSAGAGIRILGPNCLGLVSLGVPFVASWTPAVTVETLPPPSAIAYIGQSGAVGGAFFDVGRARGIVPSTWVSTGNQVDITATELAQYLVNDGSVGLVCVYLEQVPHGDDWDNLTTLAAAAGVRLALLRSGRSGSGRRAASSHTGALIAPNPAFELMCNDRGVIVVDDVNELVDVAAGWRGGITHQGRRLGIITTSGGAGSLAADLADGAGLGVTPFSADTQNRIAQVVPAFGAVENPVDVTAQLMNSEPERFIDVCLRVSESDEVDQLLVVVTNVGGPVARSLAGALGEFRNQGHALSVAYLAAEDRTADARQIMAAGGVAVFDSLGAAVRTVHYLNPNTRPFTQRPSAQRQVDVAWLPPGNVLTESAGGPVLDRLGVSRPRGGLAATRLAAEAIAGLLEGDLVLKAQSPHFLHKSDFGLVTVGVPASAVGDAFERLRSRVEELRPGAFDGVLVQELAPPGVELIIGIHGADNGYPPVVTVGMGGRFVEVYRDVATALGPLSRADAVALINTLRGSAILNGARSTQAADVESAAAVIEALSHLAVALGDELAELEINPLVVHPAHHGSTAVDLLIRRNTERSATKPESRPSHE